MYGLFVQPLVLLRLPHIVDQLQLQRKKTEDRRQKTEDRRQKNEDRRQKNEDKNEDKNEGQYGVNVVAVWWRCQVSAVDTVALFYLSV